MQFETRKEWVDLKDNTLYSGGIDLKRKAYADQAKCFIGMTQMFMEKMYQNEKLQNTDIIVQGVSVLRELAGMPAGRYGTFVADKLVNLGIRRGKAPSFVVNTEICLASDVTRSYLLGENHCYTIDNMKMSTEEALNLKQNLVNNSIIRGSKISNIAADYRDWYEEFRKKSPFYQKWREQNKLENQVQDLPVAIEPQAEAAPQPVPEVQAPVAQQAENEPQSESAIMMDEQPETVVEEIEPAVAENVELPAENTELSAEPAAEMINPEESAEQPVETPEIESASEQEVIAPEQEQAIEMPEVSVIDNSVAVVEETDAVAAEPAANVESEQPTPAETAVSPEPAAEEQPIIEPVTTEQPAAEPVETSVE